MSATLTYIRTYLVRVILIIAALSGLVTWYFVSPQADAIANELQIWNTAAASWTLFVGIITIFSHYIRSVMKRERYWPYQLYAMILMVLWCIMGVWSGLYSNLYQTAYLSTKITLHIAILGQLIFFFISGVYRTFRIKTARTLLYAFLALIMVVLNAPWMQWIFPNAEKVTFWLLNNVGMSGERTLAITGGIGGVVLSIRILLGLEKGALRATEEI
ncbi:hypothetical protein CW700_06725 [Candidatus Bathyarchaeota archaeon]|nr:MAG: hypothetical protein CW700_06725 [Candidatus Bathyarchaeota archaeon]